jgi:hypothetical protein
MLGTGVDRSINGIACDEIRGVLQKCNTPLLKKVSKALRPALSDRSRFRIDT